MTSRIRFEWPRFAWAWWVVVGRAAIDVVMHRRPDIVLMDIRMPELDGLKAAKRTLTEADLDTAVLMLTTFNRDEYVYEALRMGAS